jgi:tryptophan-rich sensory protein
MQFLLYLPAWLAIIVVGAVSVTLSLLGLKFVRRRFSSEMLRENHEVAGFIFNAFGLIYAVLLAFVVYVSWSDYTQSKRNTEIETNLIGDLFMDAEGYPDTLKTKIRQEVLSYLDYVVNREWDAMQEGSISAESRWQLESLWEIYLKLDTKQISNIPAYQESLKRFNDLVEYRRLRIISSNDFIPGVIWLVLFICAAASIGYTFFFGSKNLRAQYVMTAVLTLVNSIVLLLIFILDHPFQGSTRVTSYAFEQTLTFFRHAMGQ